MGGANDSDKAEICVSTDDYEFDGTKVVIFVKSAQSAQ